VVHRSTLERIRVKGQNSEKVTPQVAAMLKKSQKPLHASRAEYETIPNPVLGYSGESDFAGLVPGEWSPILDLVELRSDTVAETVDPLEMLAIFVWSAALAEGISPDDWVGAALLYEEPGWDRWVAYECDFGHPKVYPWTRYVGSATIRNLTYEEPPDGSPAAPEGEVRPRLLALRAHSRSSGLRLPALVARLSVFTPLEVRSIGLRGGLDASELLRGFRWDWAEQALLNKQRFMSLFEGPLEPQFGIKLKHSLDKDAGKKITELVKVLKSGVDFFMNAAVFATGGEGMPGQCVRKLLRILAPILVTFMVCKLAAVPVQLACKVVAAAANGLSSAISALFVGASEMESQWGEDGETGQVAKAALVAVMAGFVGKKVPATFWISLVSRITPFVSGAKSVIDWMIEFVQWLINKVLRLLNKDELEFFRKRAKQADEWYDLAIAAVRLGDGTAPGQAERVLQLYDDGKQLAREYPDGPTNDRIKRGMRELDAVYGSASAALAQIKGSRPEPCTIVLCGDPGAGKSVLVKRLHAGLMALTYPDELRAHNGDASRMSFTKDCGKYWDGYNSTVHKTLLIDDLGMAKVGGGGGEKEDDYTMIMRVVNTAACPLNMAHLEAKGATYFRSPYVLATTNNTQDNIKSQAALVLQTPEAVLRRLQMFVTVTRKAGPGKATPAELASNDAWDFVLVEEVDNAEQVFITDNLLELVRHVHQRCIARATVFQDTSAADRAFADALLAPAQVVQPVQQAGDEMEAQFFQLIPFACGVVGGLASLRLKKMRVDPGMVGSHNYFATLVDFSQRHQILCGTLLGLGGLAMITIWRGLFHVVATVAHKLPFFGRGKRDPNRFDLTPQSGPDSITQVDRDLYRRALYSVRIRGPVDSEKVVRGNILFVRGRAAVFPHHFLANWSEVGAAYPEAELVFTNACGESFVESISRFRDLSIGNVVVKADNAVQDDLVMAEFNTREHKDVVGRFATRSMHKGNLPTATFVRYTGECVEYGTVECRWETIQEYKDRGTKLAYVVSQPIMHTGLSTKSGDCGAIIHSTLAKDGRAIYGLHVAGVANTGTGCAIFISREWLEAAYAELTVPMVARFNDVRKIIGNTVEDMEAQGDVPPGNMVVGRSNIRGASFMAMSRPGTSMVPTAVTGWAIEDSTTQAQPLQPSDCSYDATIKALATYCDPPKLLDSTGTIRQMAKVAAMASFARHGLPSQLNDRLLTIPEAISGRNVYGRFAEPINRSTSPGYPWRAKGITKDKLFDKLGNLNVDSEAYKVLEAEVAVFLDLARHGKAGGVVFQAAPKAESRKPGKLPRLIQGAPLHYVVVWRMLFWPLMAFYGRWAPEKELGLGLNPLGDHWEQLWDYMEGFSPTLGAGDYKQFDQSQELPISQGIMDAVLGRYLPGPDSVARRTLWGDSCGPHVILGALVYKLPKGMPSGHPATGLINGLYNCTLFTMCYAYLTLGMDTVRIMPSGWAAACLDFRSNVRLAVVGDDNLFSTKHVQFNEVTLPGLMANWGARYTMDVKDGVAVSFTRPISEVTFIGRSFETRFGRKIAPLRTESIFDMGNWSLKPSLLCAAWYASVYEQTAANLAMHDGAVWGKYLPRLNKAYSGVLPLETLAREEEQQIWADKAQSLYEAHYTTIDGDD